MLQLTEDPLVAPHVRVLGRVSESTLRWLYINCLFTVYPPHVEGWGLPIAESLGFGKPCVCANTTAMGEVAPELSIGVDPMDGNRWYEQIKQLSGDEGLLEQWIDRIEKEFRPTPWTLTAEQIWQVLQGHNPTDASTIHDHLEG